MQLFWLGNTFQLKMSVVFNTTVSLVRIYPRDNDKRWSYNDCTVPETIPGILNVNE